MKYKKRPDAENEPIEPGQIRASEIIAWVLKHRTRYPLDFNHEVVYYDVPDDLAWRVRDWCSFTKSGLARYLATTPSQISRWIEHGMHGLGEDGRIWPEQAEEWQERWEKESHVHERGRI